MHIVHRILIISIIAFSYYSSSAQNQAGGKNYNFLSKENKAYYFGITLGTHTSNYKIFRNDVFHNQELLQDPGLEEPEVFDIESITGPGYNVNVLANLKIGRNFDFRLLPGFAFSERNITFASDGEFDNDLNDFELTYMEIPLQFRYKSNPYSDMRVYAFAGFKYGFDIASQSRRRLQSSIINIAPVDFSVEAGFGFQFFFPFFILSPEIKFSHGLTNTLIFDNTSLRSNLIQKILSRSLTISFHFEG